MAIKNLRLLSILTAICVISFGCVQHQNSGVRPSSSQFSSQWVKVTMGGMMAFPETGPALALNLVNKAKETIDVTVSFKSPEPKQRCTITKQIKIGGSALFQCPQSSITPDTDYPVTVDIHKLSENGKKILVESPVTKFYFSESDARGFKELAAALKSIK